MTGLEAVLKTAQDLRDVLYRLGREWEAAEEEIDDQDEQDALHLAMCEKYPLGRDIDELVAETDGWVEHLETLVASRPTVLQLVAAELGEDGIQPALTSGLAGGLRSLLLAVDGGDLAGVREHADQLARTYRTAARHAFLAAASAPKAAGNCTNCGEADDHQHCEKCDDAVYTLSSRGWCDGCEAHTPYDQASPLGARS